MAEVGTPKEGDERVIACASCGQVVLCSYGPDPFAEEIRGDHTPVWECAGCRYESARDI